MIYDASRRYLCLHYKLKGEKADHAQLGYNDDIPLFWRPPLGLGGTSYEVRQCLSTRSTYLFSF